MKQGLLILLVMSVCSGVNSKCKRVCNLTLASYYVPPKSNLTFIKDIMQSSFEDIVSYNNPIVTSKDSVPKNVRINIPFKCDCIGDAFLGHEFHYTVQNEDTYNKIAKDYFANLTTTELLQSNNGYDPVRLEKGDVVNVPVGCYCGESSISKEYGLFVTYPLRPNESLSMIANQTGIGEDLLRRYNPTANFSAGSGIIYIPGKDRNGTFVPLKSSVFSNSGNGNGVIWGASSGVGSLVLLLSILGIIVFCRKKGSKLLSVATEDDASNHVGIAPGSILNKTMGSAGLSAGGFIGISVDKTVEFSYEELANATDNFSLSHKIGQGGFGAVYYAELMGQKAAIKKMDLKASKQFLAELKVLTHVHHLNLVRFIGYCTKGSLFLIYEFMENGNLRQHLRGTGKDPLPLSTRVQIAIESARGLEYIHEYTVPAYIHRDVKSENILIDRNFHGKVADFGLTKLAEVGNIAHTGGISGTIGYLPPEVTQGKISPKMDVYAFGVVLYELISAKEAIVGTLGSNVEAKSLVAVFEDALNQPDPDESLLQLVDPRLEGNYPIDSIRKMAQLAKICTHQNPESRPRMRSVVVALTTLSSNTEDWDVATFCNLQRI